MSTLRGRRPATTGLAPERREAIDDFLKQLPLRERRLLLFCIWEEYPVDEILRISQPNGFWRYKQYFPDSNRKPKVTYLGRADLARAYLYEHAKRVFGNSKNSSRNAAADERQGSLFKS
jgi:hypothetical protein